ncbi:hypothetical protein JWG41_01265 [Leptospira sp. 201903075]|uniref:hypothetical protein n=1 Tax=Leptospira chreensis TaxID=2810035 RepID=UPI00196296CB|nr:hypothetical protein [Leptospira chreensis]MBM9589058.1 hypothetical protein [Leptospira chreensis]
MNLVVLSKPNSSLVQSLLKNQTSKVICVNEDNLYLCSQVEVVQGMQLFGSEEPAIDIPKVRAALLTAYPLIDRWISHDQSFSTTIGSMLDYTCKLIWLFLKEKPKLALLETGAPHHLFTYCLDVALEYTKVKTIYLYGNSLDERCLVFEEKNKTKLHKITDYDSTPAVDEYIDKVLKNKNFIPKDSINSLAPYRHRSLFYPLILHSIELLKSFLIKIRGFATQKPTLQPVSLQWPKIGLRELYAMLKKQSYYRKLLANTEKDVSDRISSEDIVYVGHMVPEATSFPESVYYPDEIDVLLDLKFRFPKSKVFYREHPAINIYSEFGHIHLQGLYKNKSFYQFLELNGIGFIPPSEHILKIREKGCLFATKTGRVAIENSLLSFQTILYGFPFYGNTLPGCIHISEIPKSIDVHSLKLRIKKQGQSVPKIRKYLIDHFSGSILNPGISIAAKQTNRENFETQVIALIKSF